MASHLSPDLPGSENLLFDRLQRIVETLAGLRAAGWKKHQHQFQVKAHRFARGRCLTTAQLAAFEQKHAVVLPADYLAFLQHVGEGGAGPYYGLLPLSAWEVLSEQPAGQLARPSRLLPDVDYGPDWECAAGVVADPYAGLLAIAEQGCGGYCALVVSGPARGRVVYVGAGRPHFVWDRSFLDWYERWLAELSAGLSVAAFGYTRGGSEEDLLAAFMATESVAQRVEILGSLGRTEPLTERAHPILLQAKSANEPWLRATALRTLERAGASFAPRIAEGLADPDPQGREAAVHALQALGCVAAFAESLNAALSRETDAAALFAMCKALHAAGALLPDSLRPHIDSRDEGLRSYLASFLKQLPASVEMAGFEPLLTDEMSAVRLAAREAFAKRGGPQSRATEPAGPGDSLRRWWQRWLGRR